MQSPSQVGRAYLLIAEDNPGDVHVIRLALEEQALDYDIQVVTDGEAAMDFIDAIEAGRYTSPGVILLDLNLPRVGGEQVLRRLRQIGGPCENVPVIVISSSLSPHDKAIAETLGAEAYFPKRCDIDQFLQIGALVKEMLQSKEKPKA